MEKTSNDYYEIDLLQLLQALWKRIWTIVTVAIIAGAVLFCYATFLVTPLYEAETLIYVNNSSVSRESTITPSELTAAQSLVDTYIVILNLRTTLNDVIEQAGLHYSYEELVKMIKSGAVNNTEVFSIKVTSADPQEAELIANTIADILPDKIGEIVEGSSVRIVDYATLPESKASPNVTKYTAIGMLIGMIITSLVIIIMEVTNTLIDNEEYLIQTYDLPILAIIPDLFGSSSGDYYRS
ncbi:MAG: YveK family protein [Fastidiosipilaceae bacterium]|jgi:capsular polysaccharide biosynthesis protein